MPHYKYSAAAGVRFRMRVLHISMYLALLFVVFLFSCAHKQEANYAYKGVKEESFQFLSKYTDTNYKVQIYLPKNYNFSKEGKPVIYALDGQWCFDVYSKIIDERGIEAVLVGIWQGPNGRRETDYTFVGNRNYMKFLEDELLPHVESRYKIDTNEPAHH